MLSRPVFYHPYKTTTPLSSPLKGQRPAGFRIPDYLNPKRCFNLFQGPNFTDTRSPIPSPFASPVKHTHHPEDDSPPTIRLTDLFGGAGLKSPDHRQSSPSPKSRPDATLNPTKPPGRPLAPLGNPPRKGKYGYKQLTLNSDAIRSCVLPHHRRAVLNQEKRDRVRKKLLGRHERLAAEARADFRHLRKEAETVMTEEDMTDEDRIFLKQLRELQLDQVLQHDLESCRDRMMRATDAAEERKQGFVARDQVVAKLWTPEQDLAAQQVWKKKVEEFVRVKEGKRDAARRRREEAALRAEEARRQAHEREERRLREDQERFFREELARQAREAEERRVQEARERQLQEEMERQLREARERLVREEQERLAKAEQQRQARLLAEQSRRAAQASPNDGQLFQHFALYEAKWNELRVSTSLPPIDVTEMPWPVFRVISSPEQITYQEIKAFVFHPLRPVSEGKAARDKVKTEVLRFHPDKFNNRIAPKIKPSQQEVAREIAGAVVRILTKLMTEVIEQGNQAM